MTDNTFVFGKKSYSKDTYVRSFIPGPSGRMPRVPIKIGTTAYKKILKTHHVGVDTDGIPTFMENTRPNGNKILNPLTNREIDIGGRTYTKLIKGNFTQIPERGLVEKSNLHVLDLDVKNPGGDKYTDILNNVINEYMKKLAPGSQLYLMKKMETPYKPVGAAVDEHGHVDTGFGTRGKITYEGNTVTLKNVICTMYSLEGAPYGATSVNIHSAFGALLNINILKDYQIITTVKPEQVGLLLAANDNGFCIRKALMLKSTLLKPNGTPTAFNIRFKDNTWDDVPDCCSEEDLQEVGRKHSIIFKLYNCYNLREPMWVSSTRHGSNLIVNLMVQFNHAILIPDIKTFKFADMFDTKKIVWYQYPEEEADMHRALLSVGTTHIVKPICVSSKKSIFIQGFLTETEVHKFKFHNFDLYPSAWTGAQAATLHFHERVSKSVSQSWLTELSRHIVHSGIMWCQVPSGNKVGDTIICNHYDMRLAYSSSYLCDYCTGFPDPQSPFEFINGDPSTNNVLRDYEGFGYVELPVDISYPKTVFEQGNSWYSFPQIRYANDCQENFDVKFFIVCKRIKKDIFKITREVFKQDKLIINSLFGALNRTSQHEIFVSLSFYILGYLINNISDGNPDEYKLHDSYTGINGSTIFNHYIKSKETPLIPSNSWLTAYIHSYQKITLHKDLVSKLDPTNIVRIWVDGVDTITPIDSTIYNQLYPNFDGEYESIVHEKWKKPEYYPLTLVNSPIVKNTWVTVIPNKVPSDTFNPILIEPRVALLGPPGTGKSYQVSNILTKYRKCLYTASTWLASCTLHHTAVPTQGILSRCKSAKYRRYIRDTYEVIVVDEFTLLSRSQLLAVCAIGIPVIFVGDFRQLKAMYDSPTIEWLRDDLSFHIVELTKNYRTSDEKTQQLWDSIRYINYTPKSMKLAESYGVSIVSSVSIATDRMHVVTALNTKVNMYNKEYCKVMKDHAIKNNITYIDNVEWSIGKKKLSFNAPITVGMFVIGTKSINKKSGKNLDDSTDTDPIILPVPNTVDSDPVVINTTDIVHDSAKQFMNQEIGQVTKIETINSVIMVTIRRCVLFPDDTSNRGYACIDIKYLRPAFAITFHKLQGQTINVPLVVDPSHCFDPSMIYVALTRVTNLSLLSIIGNYNIWITQANETQRHTDVLKARDDVKKISDLYTDQVDNISAYEIDYVKQFLIKMEFIKNE